MKGGFEGRKEKLVEKRKGEREKEGNTRIERKKGEKKCWREEERK